MNTATKTPGTQKGRSIQHLTEDEAREYIERLRWPEGPVCPHCGSVNVYRMTGKSTRKGLLACRDCDGHFTVTVGTVMADSHLPLATWVRAFHLIASSKKGISALQLKRNLGFGSYRTAWHLAHRIREALKCAPVAGLLQGAIQVEEPYVGGKPRRGDGKKHKRGRGTSKAPVVALVETGGNARSAPVERVSRATLRAALQENAHPSARNVTDELGSYPSAAAGFAGHEHVKHSAGQYVKEHGLHTSTVESYFAVLRRGVYGAFHHVSKKHLGRYGDEFRFQWNARKIGDRERCERAIRGIEHKCLPYRWLVGGA